MSERFAAYEQAAEAEMQANYQQAADEVNQQIAENQALEAHRAEMEQRAQHQAARQEAFTERSTAENALAAEALPVKFNEIQTEERYGKTQAEREKVLDKYADDLKGLVDGGLELSQAKLVMDLREGDQGKVGELAGKFINEGMDPIDAKSKADKLYAKKDEKRMEVIRTSGALNAGEYHRAVKGEDLYGGAPQPAQEATGAPVAPPEDLDVDAVRARVDQAHGNHESEPSPSPTPTSEVEEPAAEKGPRKVEGLDNAELTQLWSGTWNDMYSSWQVLDGLKKDEITAQAKILSLQAEAAADPDKIPQLELLEDQYDQMVAMNDSRRNFLENQLHVGFSQYMGLTVERAKRGMDFGRDKRTQRPMDAQTHLLQAANLLGIKLQTNEQEGQIPPNKNEQHEQQLAAEVLGDVQHEPDPGNQPETPPTDTINTGQAPQPNEGKKGRISVRQRLNNLDDRFAWSRRWNGSTKGENGDDGNETNNDEVREDSNDKKQNIARGILRRTRRK